MGSSHCSFRLSEGFHLTGLGIVTDSSAAEPAGGEQAANPLQAHDASRHTTTLNAKVGSTIEASLLVA